MRETDATKLKAYLLGEDVVGTTLPSANITSGVHSFVTMNASVIRLFCCQIRLARRIHSLKIGPLTQTDLSNINSSHIICSEANFRHRTFTPMAKSTGDGLAQRSHHEPQVLSNVAPTPGQRRIARAIIFALLAIFAGSWPLEAIKLPEIDAFVPSLAAALFVADFVAAVLLFGQFLILRQLALLIIADGYVFSALIVVAHALAFPGAFAPHNS